MKVQMNRLVLAALLLIAPHAAGAADVPSAAASSTHQSELAVRASASLAESDTATIRGQVKLDSGLDLARLDLSRVVVYLESDPKLDALSASPAGATVDQKNKMFIPNFLVVSKGATVEFPNWDHISHNVFSRSAAAPAFDLDRYPYGQSKSRMFDKTGVVQVFCNIHPSMRAIILVTPNRFFARADANGHFEITGVPHGKYTICAWQDRCGVQRQTIDLTASNSADASFALHEDRNAIFANDPPRHESAYGIERGLGIKRERLNLPVVQDAHPAPDAAKCENCK